MIIFYYLYQKHVPSIYSVVILCVPLYITFQIMLRNKYFISSKVTIKHDAEEEQSNLLSQFLETQRVHNFTVIDR